jgi:hypothetical protein
MSDFDGLAEQYDKLAAEHADASYALENILCIAARIIVRRKPLTEEKLKEQMGHIVRLAGDAGFKLSILRKSR